MNTHVCGPQDIDDDVFDPPPGHNTVDGSVGVGARVHTRGSCQGVAGTQRGNDAVADHDAQISRKQAGRRRRRAAKKRRQRQDIKNLEEN